MTIRSIWDWQRAARSWGSFIFGVIEVPFSVSHSHCVIQGLTRTPETPKLVQYLNLTFDLNSLIIYQNTNWVEEFVFQTHPATVCWLIAICAFESATHLQINTDDRELLCGVRLIKNLTKQIKYNSLLPISLSFMLILYCIFCLLSSASIMVRVNSSLRSSLSLSTTIAKSKGA